MATPLFFILTLLMAYYLFPLFLGFVAGALWRSAAVRWSGPIGVAIYLIIIAQEWISKGQFPIRFGRIGAHSGVMIALVFLAALVYLIYAGLSAGAVLGARTRGRSVSAPKTGPERLL